MTKFIILFSCFPFYVFSQPEAWICKPRDLWPQIAMVNEVWYTNGERYVHPSFEYAATGFLIDTGTDTLAVTVKHVLWVAKTRSMNRVDVEGRLVRWIMHPKGNLRDSVVIDKLVNSDTSEILSGPKSTITQRDWLVFTTKYTSPHIQPLKPRYTAVKTGEKIRFFGCPYKSVNCMTAESEVVEIEGNRVIFLMPEGMELGGASGSPVVDENGLLIGILGGSSMTRTGKPALYAISTNYLRDVLTHKQPLNVPLIPIGEALKPEIKKNGINAGLKKFTALKKDSKNFFIYNFASEEINALGDELLRDQKTDWAIAIYKLSIQEFALSTTYIKMAKAYLAKNEKGLAIEAYKGALVLHPENKEAAEALNSLTGTSETKPDTMHK